MTRITHRPLGFAAALRELARAIDLTFCKLARIQFDAPWRTRAGC